MTVLKNQYLAIIWSLIILILCDVPVPDTGRIRFFEGFDKLAHTGFFFVLTVLLFLGSIWSKHKKSHKIVSIIKVLFATALFGGFIELLQLEIFTYRSADWWDFFADMVGTGMGIFSYILLYRKQAHEKLA